MKEKERLKAEIEKICQSIVIRLDSKVQKNKNDIDPTTSLNFAIYDYRSFIYDKESVLEYIKQKRVPKPFWKRVLDGFKEFLGNMWVILTCEAVFLLSFYIYASQNGISDWRFPLTLFAFFISLLIYIFIQQYLKNKEILFRECVDANIIIKFDKYHWEKYATVLTFLVMLIWLILYHKDQNWSTYYSLIMSPFAGIVSAFIANVVGFSDSIYSLHEFVEELDNGQMDKGHIIILPERK